MGNTLIMERVLYLGGAVVEPKGIIKHTFVTVKTDISKINKLDKPTVNISDPKDLALGLSVLTGGIALAVGLGAVLSNFAAAFISFRVETATDFAVNQIYDKLTSEVTAKSTTLNLLPAIGGVGKLTRAARTTGKKILSDKLIFDFTKQANNETLLYTIGKLTRNDFYKGFKVSNLETINNLLKIEKNLQKISPTLVQKIPRVNEKNANKWLSEYGLNIDKISKININEWYNIMANLHKKGVGKNLILNANLMRGSKIYNNKLLNILHQTPIKLNKVLNYLNPNFYIQKVTKKLLAPIEKQIITIKQKVINKITEQTKKILSKFETKAIKKGQLLSFANFKILVVRAARVNLPTPPIAGNKFKVVLFAVTSEVNLSYIWFTAKSVAVSTLNEINAAAKLDNTAPRPTAKAIPPVKTDKPRAKSLGSDILTVGLSNLLILLISVLTVTNVCLIIPFGSTTAPPKYKTRSIIKVLPIPVPNAAGPTFNGVWSFLCKIRGSYFFTKFKGNCINTFW